MGSRRSIVCLALSLCLILMGCGSTAKKQTSPSALGDNTITVASFDFGESTLLAELYSQALENGGFAVKRAFNLGPREFVSPALARGLVELVPEYAGTALQFLSLGAARSGPDVVLTHAVLDRALRDTSLPRSRRRPRSKLKCIRGHSHHSHSLRPPHAERRGQGGKSAHLRWPARVLDPRVLPRRPPEGLRVEVPRRRCARRGRSPHPAGA